MTFLFSDIEGSTRLWERNADAMAAALADHDRLSAAAIGGADGSVFKHTGDGVCAWFESPTAVLAGALAVQAALEAHVWPTDDPIRVRIGVHSGPARRVGDDFFGPTLNRVARLMGAGHGGQTLVSEACAALVGDEAGLELLSLGQHRLRDLAEPLEVLELSAPGASASFPPIRTLDSFPNNLPAERTGFIGRADVLLDLEAVVREHRLVTLVGQRLRSAAATTISRSSMVWTSSWTGHSSRPPRSMAPRGTTSSRPCASTGVIGRRSGEPPRPSATGTSTG